MEPAALARFASASMAGEWEGKRVETAQTGKLAFFCWVFMMTIWRLVRAVYGHAPLLIRCNDNLVRVWAAYSARLSAAVVSFGGNKAFCVGGQPTKMP